MATFKAWAALNAKEKLQLYEYTPEPLADDQVEVKVTHNGLCHSDIHMKDNDWGNSTYPFIPGHEVIGEVVALGANAEKLSGLKLGDRVGYGWIRDSCGFCESCIEGQENLCYKGYEGTIVGHHGGFQNRIRMPAKFAFKIPDKLESQYAGPLMCAGATVYNPLRLFIDRPNVKVGVIGIGGLGHLAVQFASKMGFEVTALSTSFNKKEEAMGFGCTNFVLLKEASEKVPNYFDLIINTSPYDMDWNMLLGLLRPNGKLCLIGIPAVDMKVPVMPIIFSQKTICGSIVAGRKFTNEMLEFAALNGVRPKIELMKLSQCNEAMEKVLANKARYRVVLESDFE